MVQGIKAGGDNSAFPFIKGYSPRLKNPLAEPVIDSRSDKWHFLHRRVILRP
jgi:hypothetical protein